jgi:hypothetical protein
MRTNCSSEVGERELKQEIVMQSHHGGHPGSGLFSRLLFPKGDQSREDRELRFLILAFSIATFLCTLFGLALYTLNAQGRF